MAELLSAILNEGRRLYEDALYCYVGHKEAARCWDFWHWWIGVPAAVIAAAAGVTSVSGAAAGARATIWPALVAGILAFGVAAMSALVTFLDPKSHASVQYKSASEYAFLVRDLRYFCEVECQKKSPPEKLEQALKQLKEKVGFLEQQSPLIPSSAMDRARKQIKEGYYNYVVDLVPRHRTAGGPNRPL